MFVSMGQGKRTFNNQWVRCTLAVPLEIIKISVEVSCLILDSHCYILIFFVFFFSMDRHEEDLKSTLGARGTSESLYTRLQEHVRVKQRELKEMRNNLQKQKQLLSSKQMRKKMIT